MNWQRLPEKFQDKGRALYVKAQRGSAQDAYDLLWTLLGEAVPDAKHCKMINGELWVR